MTAPSEGAGGRCHIAVVGAGAAGRCVRSALRAAGFTDLVTLDRPDHEVRRSRFDDDADAWRLTTTDGELWCADVVVAAYRPAQVPWLPDIAGRDEFGGASFHAAAWDPGFDPSGKRIAVIGTDAAAAHHLGRLAHTAASVLVFAHAPRRVVPEYRAGPPAPDAGCCGHRDGPGR